MIPGLDWGQFITPHEPVRAWGGKAIDGMKSAIGLKEQSRSNMAREGHQSRVQDEAERARGWMENWQSFAEQQRQWEGDLARGDLQAEKKRELEDGLMKQLWGHDESTEDGAAAAESLRGQFKARLGQLMQPGGPKPAVPGAPTPQVSGAAPQPMPDPGVAQDVQQAAQPAPQAPPPSQPAEAPPVDSQAHREMVAQTPGAWDATQGPGASAVQGPGPPGLMLSAPLPNLGVTPPQDGIDVPRVQSATKGRAAPAPRQQQQAVPGLPGMDLAQLREGLSQAMATASAQAQAAGGGMAPPGLQVNPPTPAAQVAKGQAKSTPVEDAVAPAGTIVTMTDEDGQEYTFDAGAIKRSTLAQGQALAQKIADGAPNADQQSADWAMSVFPEMVRAAQGDVAGAFSLLTDKILNPAAQRRTSERNARAVSESSSARGAGTADRQEYKDGWSRSTTTLRPSGDLMDARRLARSGIDALRDAGPNAGAKQNQAIIQHARILQDRLSNMDVSQSPGLQSLTTRVANFLSVATEGELTEELKKNLIVSYQHALGTTVAGLQSLESKSRREWENVPPMMQARRDGMAAVINGQFGDFEQSDENPDGWFHPLPVSGQRQQGRSAPSVKTSASRKGTAVDEPTRKSGNEQAAELVKLLESLDQ